MQAVSTMVSALNVVSFKKEEEEEKRRSRRGEGEGFCLWNHTVPWPQAPASSVAGQRNMYEVLNFNKRMIGTPWCPGLMPFTEYKSSREDSV